MHALLCVQLHMPAVRYMCLGSCLESSLSLRPPLRTQLSGLLQMPKPWLRGPSRSSRHGRQLPMLHVRVGAQCGDAAAGTRFSSD
jgi:hypothetical protein